MANVLRAELQVGTNWSGIRRVARQRDPARTCLYLADADGGGPEAGLTVIAERLELIRQFIEGGSRGEFLRDTMREYAVVRGGGEACEAGWTKHQNGAELRKRHPAGGASHASAPRRQSVRDAYGTMSYGIMRDDILGGPDVAAMEGLLEAGVAFYQRNFQRTSDATRHGTE